MNRLSTENPGDKPQTKREALDASICPQCRQLFTPKWVKEFGVYSRVCSTCSLKNLRRFVAGE